jgi:uncharacterized membrane protein YqaE (UPF0057 family)
MMAKQENDRDFWRAIIAYFLPPVGVFMQVGLTTQFWINLILTLFFVLPGTIHAAWVIATIGENGQQQNQGGSRFMGLVLAPLFPPASVFVAKGFSGALVLNAVLSLFFWVPGIIHAAYLTTHMDE